MDTPEGQPIANPNNYTEPYFDELVTEFDAQNSLLLMSYVRRIEHPNDKSMNDLNEALENTEGALQHIVRKIFHGDMGTLDQRSSIVTQLFEGFIDDRLKLFGEYAQLSSLSPEDSVEIRDKFIHDVEASLLDSPEAFRDEIINQFYDFIATDAKIIDTIIENNRSRHRIRLPVPNAREVMQIGAGVALGVVVARIFTRK